MPPTTQTARRKKRKTIRPDGRHTIGRKTRSTIAGSIDNPEQKATQGRREVDPQPQQNANLQAGEEADPALTSLTDESATPS